MKTESVLRRPRSVYKKRRSEYTAGALRKSQGQREPAARSQDSSRSQLSQDRVVQYGTAALTEVNAECVALCPTKMQ